MDVKQSNKVVRQVRVLLDAEEEAHKKQSHASEFSRNVRKGMQKLISGPGSGDRVMELVTLMRRQREAEAEASRAWGEVSQARDALWASIEPEMRVDAAARTVERADEPNEEKEKSDPGLGRELDSGSGRGASGEVEGVDGVGELYRLLVEREKIWDEIGEKKFLEQREAERAIDEEGGVDRVIRVRQEKDEASKIALEIYSMKKRVLDLKIEADKGNLEVLMRKARKKLDEEWSTGGGMGKKVETTSVGGVSGTVRTLQSWFRGKE